MCAPGFSVTVASRPCGALALRRFGDQLRPSVMPIASANSTVCALPRSTQLTASGWDNLRRAQVAFITRVRCAISTFTLRTYRSAPVVPR